HQPAELRHPRVRRRGEAAGGDRRRHRHPAHGVPVDVVGPPDHRRGNRGEVPGAPQAEPGDVGLRAGGRPAGAGLRLMRDAWLIRPEGLVSYGQAYDRMHDLAQRRLAGEIPDTLILLEHPPVYTCGKRWKPEHLRWARQRMEAAGAELRFVDRGG